ncbi:hypothetical protein TIFTF001_003537 [Ficus carica]|uniref:UDP-glycosyltransferase n=1 Tax=Ficus carica TaxID=3494 RepID=A0AA87ZGA8_FICCA|nr:hypothetical protein TIFTF001_003537 [Ficus carica]
MRVRFPLGSSLHRNKKAVVLITKLVEEMKHNQALLSLGFLTTSVPLPPLPPSDSDPTGCLSWLDRQSPHSTSYISFGILNSLSEKELIATAEALEESEVPFLCSTGLHVTHCGNNSVNESLVSGVPIICRPVWADNFMIAKMVENVWGGWTESRWGYHQEWVCSDFGARFND